MIDLVLKESGDYPVRLDITRAQLETITLALNNLRNEMRLEAMCVTDQDRIDRINKDLTGLYESIARVK